MPAPSLSLTARFLLPVEGPPIPYGILDIRDGRIRHVGPADGRTADLDLGNVAVMPGLVNAHTHLELDPLPASVPADCGDEVDWLGRVVRQRRAGTPESARDAVVRNLDATLCAGTTLLADITTAGLSWPAIVQAPVRGAVYGEVLGLKRERGLENNQKTWEWISAIRPEDRLAGRAWPGLSPHAPYSTADWLYYRAAGSRMPLATHLAELPEELELLATRQGRFAPGWKTWAPGMRTGCRSDRAPPITCGAASCGRPTG